MPNRYWLRIVAFGTVALVVLAACLLYFLQYHSEHANQRQQAAAESANRANQQPYYPCRDVPRVVDRLDCFFRQMQSDQGDPYTKYDLEAQQDMAEWALALLIVSALALVVTTAGVIFVGWTLIETRRMVTETRRIGHAQVRAYVHFLTGQITVHLTESFWNTDARIVLKNSGVTPAVIKRFAMQLFYFPAGIYSNVSGGIAHEQPQSVGSGGTYDVVYGHGLAHYLEAVTEGMPATIYIGIKLEYTDGTEQTWIEDIWLIAAGALVGSEPTTIILAQCAPPEINEKVIELHF